MGSGLKVNSKKSLILDVHMEESFLISLTTKVKCGVGSSPMIYLELSLGANPRSKSLWGPTQWLKALWKEAFHLVKAIYVIGGRIILIKAYSANFPVYYMSSFKMPASLTRIFVMIRCKFLLEGVKKKKRFHLLKSNEFLKPKSGGLDIVKFQAMNPPLLG